MPGTSIRLVAQIASGVIGNGETYDVEVGVVVDIVSWVLDQGSIVMDVIVKSSVEIVRHYTDQVQGSGREGKNF